MQTQTAASRFRRRTIRRIPSRLAIWYGLVTMAIVGFALPMSTRAQGDPFEPSFAGEIMNGLSKGMEAAAGYAAFKTDFNIKIAAARKDYWSAYPDGPGVDEARVKYMEMLAAKDIANILPSLVSGPTHGLKWAKGIDVLSSPEIYSAPEDEDAVVRLDGGVHPLAEPALKAMARAIRESAGLTPDPPSPAPLNELMLIPSPSAAKAITASQEAIEAYIVARNRAEMLLGLQYMRFASDRGCLAQRLMLERAFESVEDAQQYFREIDEVLGPGRVDETAAAIRTLPVDEHGQLIHPEQLGPYSPENSWTKTVSAKAVFDIHVGQGNARDYAIEMIRLDMHVGWREALELYKTYWVEPFGEKAVLAVAEQVRVAPKRPSPGSGYLAEEIRYTRRPPEAMRRLMPHDPYRDYPLASLTDKDPKQYLYAVLGTFGPVEHWIDVPAAYDVLEARWGQRLREATATLMSAPKNRDGTLASPAELAVKSSNPHDALMEMLERGLESAKGYFSEVFTIDYWDGARQYDALVNCFGAERVDEVTALVRDAAAKHADLARLPGAVSGFHEPAQAILDILWSTASAEDYHHYMIWASKSGLGSFANNASNVKLEDIEAEVQKQMTSQIEIASAELVHAAAEKIAKAPKQPFTLYDYYHFGTKLAEPRAVDPRLAGDVTYNDVNHFHKLLKLMYEDQKEPPTLFKVGDEFEIEFRGAWRKAKILRVQPLAGGSANYTIQVDYPGQAPFSRLENWLRSNSRPVQDSAGSGTASRRDASAPAEEKIAGDEFPVGSTVQLKIGRDLVRGIVRQYKPGWGWQVELQQARPVTLWYKPEVAKQREMKLIEDAPRDAQPDSGRSRAARAESEGGRRRRVSGRLRSSVDLRRRPVPGHRPELQLA